jgi:hypothetical protein
LASPQAERPPPRSDEDGGLGSKTFAGRFEPVHNTGQKSRLAAADDAALLEIIGSQRWAFFVPPNGDPGAAILEIGPALVVGAGGFHAMELVDDPGQGTAADRKVQLQAAQAVLGEQGSDKAKGVTVNVGVGVQIQPGYMVRVPAQDLPWKRCALAPMTRHRSLGDPAAAVACLEAFPFCFLAVEMGSQSGPDCSQ